MACTVYQKNKKTGMLYAYRSESYRDPSTGKPKVRRTYLGRVDNETNTIIPKAEDGKRNRSKLGGEAPNRIIPEEVKKQLEDQRAQIISLSQQLEQIQTNHENAKRFLNSMRKLLDEYERTCI